jgi:hypothetical protein
MENRYLVESGRSSVAADMRALMECLQNLGERFGGNLKTFRDLDAENKARRLVLAPQMRDFNKLDAEGKQAGMDRMFKAITREVDKLSAASANYLRQWQQFENLVNGAKSALVQLQAGVQRDMLEHVAALSKSWERQAAATSCWVEVYDQDPISDKTAVRLRCGYISEADDMLEGLCALLPIEEWDQVYCCSPGEFSTNTKLFMPLSGGRPEQVRDRLEANNKLVFHDDQAKKQLVIVRR